MPLDRSEPIKQEHIDYVKKEIPVALSFHERKLIDDFELRGMLYNLVMILVENK